MHFLMVLLGVILGVVLFLGIIALVIYSKIKITMKKMGYKADSLSDIAKEAERIRIEESTKARSIPGITTLLLPNIRNDFPDFNEQELYNRTEKALREVFSAIENKNIEEISDLPLLKDSIQKIIEDYENSNISEKWDDIQFHKFALYQYEKKNGMATITVSTSVGYYYQKKKDDKVLTDFTKYKKQTRYHCKFIYVYDENLVDDSSKVLSINCPNCGAAIKSLGHKYCDYCGTAVEEVNLKSWECSSYVEF